MFNKAKVFMEDHLKAFGVTQSPTIVEATGEGVTFVSGTDGSALVIGSDTVIETLPLAEWLIATGQALLYQNGSDISALFLDSESDRDDLYLRVADDLRYIADLAAIYQCYLQNPVETYCIYDEAIEINDETSLHPIAVALGLSHPRGLAAMGFDENEHQDVFEEADFFRSVVTQKRPDLSLLVALQNAWQKHKGVKVKIAIGTGVLTFAKIE
jgi:hypothetical protein